MVEITGQRIGAGARPRGFVVDAKLVRTILVAAAVIVSLLFVMVGTAVRLQLFADGSLFSFAIAVQESWAIHWHNISGRVTVYLYAHVLPQAVVWLSGDIGMAVRLYGFLLFIAPLLGLAATYAADRSRGQTFFTFACLSTLLLCPLIFGFPSEMWIAHALFWPVLTVCHFASGRWSIPVTFLSLLALMLTHEGALIFTAAILLSLSLRVRKRLLLRAFLCMLAAAGVWLAIRMYWQPDAYIARFIHRAAMQVFNPEILTLPILSLFVVTLSGFALLACFLRRFDFEAPFLGAFALTAIGLSIYWMHFDSELHVEGRYYLRTLVIVLTPLLGLLATALAFERTRWASGLTQSLRDADFDMLAPAALCALALIVTIHAVENAKFVREWSNYLRAVRSLSMSSHSDISLGSPRFVSSQRLGARTNRLAWDTTTPYLSVMIAPEAPPKRLLVDPNSVFLWISCHTATDIMRTAQRLPSRSREMIRTLSCTRVRI